VFPRASRSSRGGWSPTTSQAKTLSSPSSEASAPDGRPAQTGLPRIDLRLDRLHASFSFTYAFHAREIRFERETPDGRERLFAETFSFHPSRHDPTELSIQLEDLWSNPRLITPHANRRDAEDLMRRFLAALPRCLEGAIDRLESEAHDSPMLGRVCEDVALLAHVVSRFLAGKHLEDHPQLRVTALHLRKLVFRTTAEVVRRRVRPEAIQAYVAGELELDTGREFGAYYALAGEDQEKLDRTVLGVAERAFYRWLEDVCLDETHSVFESEGSPFEDRAREVLRAVASDGGVGPVRRTRELSLFLRRPANRDCNRVLEKLETWFLRQYDVHHGAVVLHHANQLRNREQDPDRVLSWHSRRTYLLGIGIPAIPFVLAVFFYREPWARWLDWWVSFEVVSIISVAVWFLGYRFLWRKDLTFFHAAVPRIAAGIIVGYLPVFLIDEVWDLAEQSFSTLVTVVTMLGMPTLLYIHVEVKRRLGDANEAFRRALDIFLLGLLQSAAFGLVVTSFLGRLMSTRNWGDPAWREGVGEPTLAALSGHLEPVFGLLPRVVGVEPFPAFPTAVFLMSFLAFFIGTFLQLLWEELPITEPM
jgi:hypothetical protein